MTLAFSILNMQKKLLVAALFTGCTIFAFSQSNPRLGILPFAGGSVRDGETIAQLFSIQPDIMNAFTIIPRTDAVNAIVAEQNFQMTGYTDSDTIARLGRMLNADFVVSGNIHRLGDRNLIIATIVNVETFELLVGDYRVYSNIEEVQALLPSISGKMITAVRRDTSRLPKLAVAPFHIASDGVNVRDAEILAEILAIEIINAGGYAVLPRTSTMQAALEELKFQRSGYTIEDEAIALGKAANAEYLLSARTSSLGSTNMFFAQILHVEDGSQLTGDQRNYRVVEDGRYLIAELAVLLVDPDGAESRIRSLRRERTRVSLFEDPAKFWSIGASAGTSFAAPWIIGTVSGTIAPFRNSFFELGLDFGMISGISDAEKYYSLYPFVHYTYFRPFMPTDGRQSEGGLYAGGGFGFMRGEYTFPEGKIPVGITCR